MIKQIYFSFITIILIFNLNYSQTNNRISPFEKPLREKINFNNNWLYLENNSDSLSKIMTIKKGWQPITLPHTWNKWDATDYLPGYRRDISWYKKSFNIKANENFAKYLLYFEGSNITTEVFVNNKFAGKHIGGYVGFKIDITKFIKKGTLNIVYVKVDNSINKNIIPSQKSDFFIYGGITRDVWLEKLPVLNINNVQIKTPKVSETKADIETKVTLDNLTKENKQLDIIIKLHSPTDNIVAATKQIIKCTSGKNIITLKFPSIKNPKLWSPDTPFLYSAKIFLVQKNIIIDSLAQTFGLRWYEFKEHGPFFLNGKRLLLRGTHRHEEFAGYGAAMPNALHKKDIQMIKNMGANFIRLAHYPQDPEIYKACDELGVLVWDELPWCRGGVGNKEWKRNTTRLLTEQINQNINHPCIILWSLGNEIYWDPDFNNGDNIDSINTFLTGLNNLAHQLDPTRLTAIRKYYEGANIVDVFSPSIWAGWYSGSYKDYTKSITSARKKYPRFFHAEYGGASHVGRHDENPIDGKGIKLTKGWEEKPNQIKVTSIAKNGDWSENYIVKLFDWHLHISEQLDWFTGNAQWAFRDFGTPLRPENPIPFVNQKGLLDRAGKPKDAYYVFKSYWNTKDKFCYIESHTWTERRAKPNQKLIISVYSNCNEVELFVNKKSLGKRKRNIKNFPACGLTWDVLFKEGKNSLTAIGYNKNVQVTSDSLTINFSTHPNGTPEKISLNTKVLENGNKLIVAKAIDKNGERCLNYNKKVYFSINGHGKLLINYGTPTRSQVIEMSNGKAAIEFSPSKNGKAIIEVRNQDFKGSYITVGK